MLSTDRNPRCCVSDLKEGDSGSGSGSSEGLEYASAVESYQSYNQQISLRMKRRGKGRGGA